MALRITPLGAGRHVGRSCILVEIAGSRVLVDCGIRPGCHGPGELPEFAALTADGRDIANAVDLVLISHFHLDHIGALPYLTEVLGYRGPIFMTHPTRAIAPVVLTDYVRLGEERGRGQPPYSMPAIGACFERVTCFQLQERCVIGDLAVTSFYAGHVIGAVMLLLECRGRRVLYTGDFTMVPDHYLSVASAPLGLRPDVMITESTYSTTIRSSKRQKELDLCRKIQATLDAGGKVLVPVFMMGRAQELCLICEKHWARAGLHYPIRIIRGMAEKAINFFRLFSAWSSDSVRKADKPFNFPHMSMCDVQDVLEAETPMVVFAGPSMLTGGPALRIFKEWACDGRNLVLFAGYCLPGTLGNEVLAKQKQLDVGGGETVDVRCQVDYMSHSDHTDARGILQFMAQVAPKHVILVHGAESVIRSFKPLVEQRYHLPCSDPAVGETVDLSVEPDSEVLASPSLLRHARPLPAPPLPLVGAGRRRGALQEDARPPPEAPCSAFSGLLRKRPREAEDEGETWELLDRSAAGATAAGLRLHRLRYLHEAPALPVSTFRKAWAALSPELQRSGTPARWLPAEPPAEGLLPPGGAWEAALLSATKCRLQAPPRAAEGEPAPNGAAVVSVVLEWTREDAQNAAVAHFLETLGAG